jgi:hypothetical protein
MNFGYFFSTLHSMMYDFLNMISPADLVRQLGSLVIDCDALLRLCFEKSRFGLVQQVFLTRWVCLKIVLIFTKLLIGSIARNLG